MKPILGEGTATRGLFTVATRPAPHQRFKSTAATCQLQNGLFMSFGSHFARLLPIAGSNEGASSDESRQSVAMTQNHGSTLRRASPSSNGGFAASIVRFWQASRPTYLCCDTSSNGTAAILCGRLSRIRLASDSVPVHCGDNRALSSDVFVRQPSDSIPTCCR